MTTPKALTEADAAAALAGLPRPVSSEGARAHADFLDFGGHEKPANLIRTLVSERDALAGRVAELEDALDAFIEYDDNTDEDGISMMERYAVAIALARAAPSTTPESKP